MKVFILIEKFTNRYIGVFSTEDLARSSNNYTSSCNIVEEDIDELIKQEELDEFTNYRVRESWDYA